MYFLYVLLCSSSARFGWKAVLINVFFLRSDAQFKEEEEEEEEDEEEEEEEKKEE